MPLKFTFLGIKITTHTHLKTEAQLNEDDIILTRNLRIHVERAIVTKIMHSFSKKHKCCIEINVVCSTEKQWPRLQRPYSSAHDTYEIWKKNQSVWPGYASITESGLSRYLISAIVLSVATYCHI